jgi:hypothetical protein
MGLGIVIFGSMSDRLVKRHLQGGERHRPEIRLTPWFTLPAGITLPIGLFLYGWTIQYHVHWIVPMLGVVIFAFGLMGVMVRSPEYLLFPLFHLSNLLILHIDVCTELPLGKPPFDVPREPRTEETSQGTHTDIAHHRTYTRAPQLPLPRL